MTRFLAVGVAIAAFATVGASTGASAATCMIKDQIPVPCGGNAYVPEAPVYAAPVYPAPVYQAPVYYAPAYPAPYYGPSIYIGGGYGYGHYWEPRHRYYHHPRRYWRR